MFPGGRESSNTLKQKFKHTQTIRRLLATNCLSVFDHIVGLALEGFLKLIFLK